MSDTFLTAACFSIPPKSHAECYSSLSNFLKAGREYAPPSFTTLPEALAFMGFAPFTDAQGNLCVCHEGLLEGDNFGDDPFYRTVAPFLADGSYFEVEHDRWYYRVYVRDGSHDWYEGRLVYDEPGSLAMLAKVLREKVDDLPPVPAASMVVGKPPQPDCEPDAARPDVLGKSGPSRYTAPIQTEEAQHGLRPH